MSEGKGDNWRQLLPIGTMSTATATSEINIHTHKYTHKHNLTYTYNTCTNTYTNTQICLQTNTQILSCILMNLPNIIKITQTCRELHTKYSHMYTSSQTHTLTCKHIPTYKHTEPVPGYASTHSDGYSPSCRCG